MRKENDAADRVRAPKATVELTKGALRPKLESKDTWENSKAASQKKAVYKNSVCELDSRLTADMSLGVTNRGCYLNPAQLMPLFLHRAARDDVLHAGNPDGAVALDICFHANNMFQGRTCQLVSLSLPHAKHPHQLG